VKKEELEERKEDKAIRKKGVPEVGMLSRDKSEKVRTCAGREEGRVEKKERMSREKRMMIRV